MSKKFNCSMQKKIESLTKKSEADIDKSKREFDIAFKTGKNTVFEIDYYRCGSNDEPYFSTAATIYYPNHRGMSRGGQCQDDALKDNKVFYDFYKKWNPKHLHKLTDDELDELETDIEALKKAGYPYVEAEDGDWENRVSRRSSELIRQKLPRSLQDSPIAQKIEAMMLPKSSMQKKKESLNEDATIATSDIKKALNEVANEVKPNVDEVRVEDNLDIVGPGARAEIYIDSAGDKIWWFTVKTKDNSIEVTDPDNEDHNYGKFNDIEGMKDLFKKFLQEDIKNDTISANDALKDEPEEVQVMVRELAKETGNNYGDAAIESYAPGNGVCVTFGNEEYYCYADYSDAEEASNEGVKNLLDDIGIDGINFDNIGGIEQFVDTNWFDEAKRESAEFYVSDIKESEPERYKEEFGDLDEEDAVEQVLSGMEEDSIQWYINDFGKEDFNSVVKDKGLVDLDALAEAITDADGPANELASYDGEEIELPCGYYCYRHN